MTVPNTGVQPTGMMTLESGLVALKAKMAEGKTTAKEQVTITLDDDGVEMPAEEAEQIESEPASEETAESVSADESQAETEEPDNRPVILPDGSEITVEEARKGYLRQADFTKKTTEVARERDAIAFREQAALKEFGALYQQLASLQETEPNWMQRSQEVAPEQYNRERAEWEHKKAVMGYAQRTMADNNARMLAVEKSKAREALSSGAFDPSWKDPKVLSAALNNISDYWIERGLPSGILEGITDPTIIEVVEESRRWRELQKSKPKAALAVKGKPAPFKPGAKSTATPQTETLRLLGEAFRKNPSIDNATALERARSAARR